MHVYFLSTVTDELPGFRNDLAEHLRTRHYRVRYQERFAGLGMKTLPALWQMIEWSTVVLHVVGKMSGSIPPADQIELLIRHAIRTTKTILTA